MSALLGQEAQSIAVQHTVNAGSAAGFDLYHNSCMFSRI